MGYSIYFVAKQSEVDIVKKMFTEEWYTSVDWQICGIQTDPSDLSYVSDKYKDRLVIGVDYGDHAMSHAVLATIVKLMGKKQYLYDSGAERCKADSALWWKLPEDQWSSYKKRVFPFMQEEIKDIDRVCDLVVQRYNEVTKVTANSSEK